MGIQQGPGISDWFRQCCKCSELLHLSVPWPSTMFGPCTIDRPENNVCVVHLCCVAHSCVPVVEFINTHSAFLQTAHNISGAALSVDGSHLLLVANVQKVFRHSFLADYYVMDVLLKYVARCYKCM